MSWFRSYRYRVDKHLVVLYFGLSPRLVRAITCAGLILALLIGIVVYNHTATTSTATQEQPQTITNPTITSNSAPRIQPSTDIAHKNIISTVFWVGEVANSSNGHIPNASSYWDELWQKHYGGIDNQSPRNGYLPRGFTPQENPFYFALPYGDIADKGDRKASSQLCEAFTTQTSRLYSPCKNSWIAITKNGKTAYAQWEDVGPYEEDDTAYVFGAAQSRNTLGEKAGLDVSPAVQTYLKLDNTDNVEWRFVKLPEVPAGPWKNIITTSAGHKLEQ